MPESSKDPRTYIKLADGKPLMRAIPKHYLSWLAMKGNYESQGNLAKRLSTSEHTIHRQTVCGWINGTLHMSNRDVIHVSHVLNVSPLCVLDLCGPSETENPHAYLARHSMTDILLYLSDWQATGKKPRLSNIFAAAQLADLGAVNSAEEIADWLRYKYGDYRDLKRLAIDAATYYAESCDPEKYGSLILRITEAGRIYGIGEDSQAQ